MGLCKKQIPAGKPRVLSPRSSRAPFALVGTLMRKADAALGCGQIRALGPSAS